MNDTPTPQRRPWWDLVGLALTRDRRFLIFAPCMYLAAWAVSRLPGADVVPDALYEAPRVLLHWLGALWAWI